MTQYPTCKPGKCSRCGKKTTTVRVEVEAQKLCITCFTAGVTDTTAKEAGK